MSSSLLPSETSEDDILKCVICCRDAVDPVLLSCLHSACSSCTGSDVSDSVTCPTCLVATDVTTRKTNLLVSSLAHRSLVLKDVFSCTQCTAEDKQDTIAVVWCYTCQRSLCVDCEKYQSPSHSTHKLMPLNERTNLSELYLPPARSCTKHDEKLLFACFTCRDGRCFKCAHDCYKSSHDVLPLDSHEALKQIKDEVMEATRELSELNVSLAPLQANLRLPEKVHSDREKSLATLQKAKKKVIDLTSNAYDNAAESLLECWDSLTSQSFTLRGDAERLMTRVSWTNKYCKLFLNSNDVTGLLPQLDIVRLSLKSRLEEARQFEEPGEPSKRVRINTCLPSDLDLIASGWFGQAKVVSDDFNCSVRDYSVEDDVDYYNRKVSTLKELELLLQSLKEQQEIVQCERQAMAKLQSEFVLKDELLVTTQNEVKKLLDEGKAQQQHLEGERKAMELLKSELKSKTEQLVTTQNDVKKFLDERQALQQQLEGKRKAIEILLSELKSKTEQHVTSQNEVKKLLDERKAQQQQLEKERKTTEQLKLELKSKTDNLVTTQNEVKNLRDERNIQQQHFEKDRKAMELLKSELKSKTEQFVTTQNEVKKLRDERNDQQQHLEKERKAMELLKSELKTKTEQLAAETKPLSFGSKPRGTFKGPGSCFDVAVTPQGRLLVAATADGLKEYDATSFREIATWKPDAYLLGQDKSFFVTTVDVLSDGRALVGLYPKLVVLLQRGVASSGDGSSSSAAAAAWRVERRVAVLQAPPRHLSAWGDRLLAVLENRWDESTKSWCSGPGLVLLSLSDGGKQLHRQQLHYNALSVALTDRGVIVSSSDQVELTDAVGSGGGNRKCYVVDCYSHLGVRLWRHELDGGHKVMSVCSDSVGRVLYAAKCRGPVVALRADDGRELSTVITLSTTETEASYAIRLERARQRRMALIKSAGDDQPNIISIFSVL